MCKIVLKILIYVLLMLLNVDCQTNEVVVLADNRTLVDQISDSNSELVFCDSNRNCSLYQICLNGVCRCKADYSWNSDGKCQYENCPSKPESCSQQDPNRFCQQFLGLGQCFCRDSYIEDHKTGVCRLGCNNDQFCEQHDSPNSHCNVYRCQCLNGFKRNSTTEQCEPFLCSNDSNCWSNEEYYWTCRNGTCVCDYDFDPRTKQCTIKLISIFKFKYYSKGRVERLLLATTILVPIIFLFCLIKNYRKAQTTIAVLKQPNLATVNHFKPITVDSIIDSKQWTYQVYDQYHHFPSNRLDHPQSVQSGKKSQTTKKQFKYSRFQ